MIKLFYQLKFITFIFVVLMSSNYDRSEIKFSKGCSKCDCGKEAGKKGSCKKSSTQKASSEKGFGKAS